ncbi:MAG: protein PhnA [Pseudomonadales bacterium]|jgi:protein PhnA
MSIEQALHERSESKCELCAATNNLASYKLPPDLSDTADNSIMVCDSCLEQINDPATTKLNHWRCLNDSMWSQVPAVQVMTWRLLNRIKGEGWPADLLERMYLEDDTLKWAQATGEDLDDDDVIKHFDSNGTKLSAGDTVTLIKDLDVKGTSFVAKRGTAVRGIGLVGDNPEHIEGRVNGTRIVILTKFVKKS